jgi:nitrogen regulatory protein P-II 1
MYEIKAYVKQGKADDVVDALAQLEGVKGIAVVPLQEYGHAQGSGKLTKVEMVKLELDVSSRELADTVARCIVEHARTGEGHTGDGHVLVSEVGRAIRIEDGADQA